MDGSTQSVKWLPGAMVRVGDITSSRGRRGILPISKSTWWQRVREGKAPPGIKLGEGITAWRLEDVQAFATGLQARERNGGIQAAATVAAWLRADTIDGADRGLFAGISALCAAWGGALLLDQQRVNTFVFYPSIGEGVAARRYGISEIARMFEAVRDLVGPSLDAWAASIVARQAEPA